MRAQFNCMADENPFRISFPSDENRRMKGTLKPCKKRDANKNKISIDERERENLDVISVETVKGSTVEWSGKARQESKQSSEI